MRREIEEAERAYDLNRAAELRHGKLPRARAPSCRAEEERLAEKQGGDAACCARRSPRRRSPRSSPRWTGIPVTRLVEGEREKLLRLDEILHQRVIGQDEAVQLVADAVIRARAGHQGPAAADRLVHLPRARPASARPSSRKALAEALFDSEDNMVRIDMSEYMEKHTVSRLIGAPPGYVGYEEGGQLTEAVRRKPYSRGPLRRDREGAPRRLQRAAADPRRRPAHRRQGRTVDFKNTVIIMTSNIGSPLPARGRRRAAARSARTRATRVMARAARRTSGPSSSTAWTTIVLFKPLHARRRSSGSSTCCSTTCAKRLADRRHRARAHRGGARLHRPRGLRPGLRRAAAEALPPARGRDAGSPARCIAGEIADGAT